MITPAQMLRVILTENPRSISQTQKTNAQIDAMSLGASARYATAYQMSGVTQIPLTQNVYIDSALTYIADDQGAAKSTSSINAGALFGDSSLLEAASQLTPATPEYSYSFTLESSSLKLEFDGLTDTNGLRVQIIDSRSEKVVADNYGTDEQKESYNTLTSPEGMKTGAGEYSIKVSYASNDESGKERTFSFSIKSVAPDEKDDATKPDPAGATHNAVPSQASSLYGQAQGHNGNESPTVSTLA